jgi:hypothetical protein
MHEKLPASIRSLSSWTDKILTDSKGRDWRLQDFIQTYNLSDYQKFYRDLYPFISPLISEDKELYEEIVRKYESNDNELSEAMKDNYLFESLFNFSIKLPFMSRSADDLIEVIRQINSNVQNLDYAIKVAKS